MLYAGEEKNPKERQLDKQSTSSYLARSTHGQGKSSHAHSTWAASVLPKPAASEGDREGGKSPEEGGRAGSRGAAREQDTGTRRRERKKLPDTVPKGH